MSTLSSGLVVIFFVVALSMAQATTPASPASAPVAAPASSPIASPGSTPSIDATGDALEPSAGLDSGDSLESTDSVDADDGIDDGLDALSSAAAVDEPTTESDAAKAK